MAAVDFVTGYITNYVDGMVRPYVEQGAAAVGDVAGGVMFSVGDKISSASRGVGETITGYSTGVGRSIGGVAGSIPGAPKTSEATKKVEQSAGNPHGLSGQASKGANALKQKPIGASKASTTTGYPKPSYPSQPTKKPIPSSLATRGTSSAAIKVTSGVTGAAKGASNKASSAYGGLSKVGGAFDVPKAIGGPSKTSANPASKNVGGAFDVPKAIGGAPKSSAAPRGGLSKAGGAHEVPTAIESAPQEAERRPRRVRKTRKPRV